MGVGLTLPSMSFAGDWATSRQLKLYRSQTGEGGTYEYWKDGKYNSDHYVAVCRILKDVRSNVAVQMDPVLLEILSWSQAFLSYYGHTQPLVITSGYRSPGTNRKTEGAARNSMHLYGKAVDLVMPGISIDYLGKLFRFLRAGGVGVYQTKNFVHVDSGALRAWHGK